ncbi:Crp/Fnr family transcriptional regulator [Aetokthonos hydrillicola Thurmond2011]|jgi:CRP/FNR family transcriptional regulator|uniref:Crp/Fnr family transcriptional regulator n=1 Tax=Aetokthonos hydrillicola Thurmond2011 TaxID=2712845 RepID=A0AAP5I513_9CYAN|nr:Crp/Fnr family transcriptional regulator [Aetokthonos hydrillicola]MBO3458334.1 Crp/Fnr family transcriptional regulator [Aetokthonos hydrillicola CCALA 1050]MBW4585898.1 Crp/Fnr family transcriptional regulator [Aetokthonos hydrillicola CCALA 1050]MDR9893877.1 Crp/Fnr family transcriptional regulator [Aetokthonos hydrillicola Thurmond2011]
MKNSVNNQSEFVNFLNQTQMFQGLSQEHLGRISDIAIAQLYNKGDMIFHQGDEAKGFFVVKSGRVKVFKQSADGKEQILHVFGLGDHFAEVPAFDGKCYPASAAGIEKTELLFFPRTSFLELLEKQPTLAVNMLKSFARHLRRFSHLIDNLSLREVPARLATYLLNLSERTGNLETVELDLTKGQLAAMLGTIPETLSRVFYKLSRDGLIKIDGSKISLLNREALSKLVDGV